MKKYTIIFSKAAEHDINNIFSYIESVSSKEDAKKVTSSIVKKTMRLDYFPERSEPIGKDRDGNPIRTTISGKYRIIYVVRKRIREVFIARIISISQDTRDIIE